MNKVVLVGRLTAKPELRYTPQNTASLFPSALVKFLFTATENLVYAVFCGV